MNRSSTHLKKTMRRGPFPLMTILTLDPRARRMRPNLTLGTERSRGRDRFGREGEAGDRGGESWVERGRSRSSGEEGEDPKVEEKFEMEEKEGVWK